MEERRGYPRIKVEKGAALMIENRINPIPCTVDDISVSGVRLTMPNNLLPEVFSDMNLVIPDFLSFNAGAHVAWQDESGGRSTYGLSFNSIDDIDRQRIAEYIRENSFKDLRDQWWKGL